MFHNTLQDLQDCYNVIDDDPDKLSESERTARKRLIEICCNIADLCGDEIE
jgi:hypothetical protein